MRTHIYWNLTQCAGKGKRYVYIRSTDIEQANWHRLLWSVPDEWFFLLAQGDRVRFIDCSTHKRGKVERIFVPILNDVLNQDNRTKLLKDHYAAALDAFGDDRQLFQRYAFWIRRFAGPVVVEGRTVRVEREPNPMGG